MIFVCDVCDFHIIVYHVSRPVHLHVHLFWVYIKYIYILYILYIYIYYIYIYMCVCFDSLIRSQPVLLGLIDQPEVIDPGWMPGVQKLGDWSSKR
jgi:hypothetical protein